MKNCVMCGTDREDVSIVRVVPATWNGFHDFADVCAECQTSRRFKLWQKPRTSAGKSAPAAAQAGETAPAPSVSASVAVRITHRRTGDLLCVVENHTLAGSCLRNAALSGADLQNAGLRGADLLQADLRLADLGGADLRGSDLRGANFRGADLRGADLREARIYRTDLNHALYDEQTLWPAGFDPGLCGARKEARSR